MHTGLTGALPAQTVNAEKHIWANYFLAAYKARLLFLPVLWCTRPT